MKSEQTNRSQRVREVIHEMGFGVKNPPPGWRVQVEKQLLTEGITVNQSAIYKQQRAMAKATTKATPRDTTAKAAAPKTEAPKTGGTANNRPPRTVVGAGGGTVQVDGDGAGINARHLVSLNTLAKEMGGWDELMRAVEWLRRIKFDVQ